MQPLAKLLGQSLGQRLRDSAVEPDIVVPVPLHWRRRLSREFNQAALVATIAARVIGSPTSTKSMKRAKPTVAQAGLTDAQRITNVRSAFRVVAPERLRNRRVLIVDDVMTTGSTLAACARAVKRAGAKSVVVAALARAHRERLLI